eukprot:TRINITY_DN18054_c0_g2_i2.p1 TRINITY_DN18054_c0_g2~~TRINITY_DN18054_c0_g2_i2.p1  ORF type:complete len:540 (+),score=139.24 TRINITY_DN18054_c0_g2_i2:112-1731(+)
MDDIISKKFFVNRWVVLVASCFVVLCTGTLYGFGQFSQDLAVSVGRLNVDYVGGFADWGMYTGIFAGLLYEYFGEHMVLVFSAVLSAGGYFLCYMVVKNIVTSSVALLCLAFWMIGQGSISAIFSMTLVNSHNFPRNRQGLVIGLIQGTAVTSTIVFIMLYTHVLNRDIETFTIGRVAVIVIGFCLSVFWIEKAVYDNLKMGPDNRPILTTSADGARRESAPSSSSSVPEERVVVVDPAASQPPLSPPLPPDNGRHPEDAPLLANQQHSDSNIEAHARDQRSNSLLSPAILTHPVSTIQDTYSLSVQRFRSTPIALEQKGWPDILSEPEFWLISLVLFLVIGPALMFKNMIGTFTRDLGLGEDTREVLVLLWVGLNAGSRIILGLSSDYFSTYAPRATFIIFGATLVFLGHACFLIFGTSAIWAAASLSAFGYGTTSASATLLILLFFGRRHFALNFGLCTFLPAVSGLVFTGSAVFVVHQQRDFHARHCEGERCFLISFIVTSVALFFAIIVAVYLRRSLRSQVLYYKESTGADPFAQ